MRSADVVASLHLTPTRTLAQDRPIGSTTAFIISRDLQQRMVAPHNVTVGRVESRPARMQAVHEALDIVCGSCSAIPCALPIKINEVVHMGPHASVHLSCINERTVLCIR